MPSIRMDNEYAKCLLPYHSHPVGKILRDTITHSVSVSEKPQFITYQKAEHNISKQVKKPTDFSLAGLAAVATNQSSS